MRDERLEKMFAEAQADLMALERSGAGMPFVFKPSEAFFLLSVLQLALRHPHLEATAPGQWARTLAEDIERRIAKTDALAFMARAGWDRSHDETAAAAPAPESASTSDEARKPRRTVRGRK